jgi:pimeloyl-[acyl-carrier protein] methyl ester esterase
MSLYVRETGEGQPLCLLHGWALNSRVWDPVVDELQQSNRVMAIDLPGHGKSVAPEDGEYTVDSLAKIISQQLKPGTILAGWSLGGMIAINIAAKYPELVNKLILISSSPQFANSDSWEYGIKKSIIDSFANDLTTNYRETIHRFLAIQMFGCDNAKLIIRDLREKVFANGEPHIDSLSKGLQILKNCNLWKAASQIKCPTAVILGEKDTLIPQASGERTRQTIPQCELKIIKSAGHAPFVSHSKEFLKIVNNFINE